MRGEAVRGVIPEPSLSSLPGIERAQALRQGLIARPPLARLMGLTVTQVSPGAATMTLRASPWLDLGTAMDILILAEVALSTAVLTGAPAGTDVRTASFSVTQFRPASRDANLIAHARTLTSAPGTPSPRWPSRTTAAGPWRRSPGPRWPDPGSPSASGAAARAGRRTCLLQP